MVQHSTETNKKDVLEVDIEKEIEDTFSFLRIRIKPIISYQLNKYGVVSPNLVFWSVHYATSWRWSLTRNIIFLQTALGVVLKEDPLLDEVVDLELLLQKYINAANAVLVQYYDCTEKYEGINLRDEVDRKIFSDSIAYLRHQRLFVDHENLKRRLLDAYPELGRRN
ncbi:MAG: hypothetical protein A3A89_02305 [Candidatus Magasanikbacteria bacterium RIFCSPLOWO2_01_FULL_33_34]|nr:MAG: hypothetical protein A3B83_01485 [Candidatus Magasanikbacteria bacterium RIFCSPHIGHO2_02_FULL_33_17]OGH76241.1 MAG: hypothetical protein A3A89_02305 [Candidatus Magasanikbacteria bacterium RIFCSPLOWO2_01_FULL_33_34]